eukprot:CAMPEP_0197035564 /NCGR_PEP_ID=MMETSP1384-20130603/13327_1 /TAXON_ID=29189 /ORGANISM="Ammonia sp." /LENGTH=421 /DNA_ID=CAMNT_0042465643 /DNA_START=10 /DNA_END=1275 /DNA_ORIENTATION=+
MALLVAVLVSVLCSVKALDNGLARTPPMGWLSWERFRCELDCTDYPDDCINEQLYMQMADRLANDGWKDVGYTQVNIDDCWSAMQRDNVTNELVPDPVRFPNGIIGVAKYVHSLGLKLGLYNDIGTKTCGGFPGIDGNYQLDANTFASWEIDMIKIDGCNGNVADYYQTYPMFGAALNKTGRPMIYSCSWPAYISGHGETVPPVDNTTLAEIAESCNLWRNYYDVQDSWDSVEKITSYWSRPYLNYSKDALLNVAGPGQWNDPDMIIGGDNGLSLSEATTQFALWSIFAAPLLLSSDLRSIDPEFKALLQNQDIIAVNQDPMGKQGGWIQKVGNSETIWMRELTDDNSIAVVLQNTATAGFGVYMTFDPSYIPQFVRGWSSNTGFKVRNLVNQTDLGTFSGKGFKDLIQPSSVGMYKLTPV